MIAPTDNRDEMLALATLLDDALSVEICWEDKPKGQYHRRSISDDQVAAIANLVNREYCARAQCTLTSSAPDAGDEKRRLADLIAGCVGFEIVIDGGSTRYHAVQSEQDIIVAALRAPEVTTLQPGDTLMSERVNYLAKLHCGDNGLRFLRKLWEAGFILTDRPAAPEPRVHQINGPYASPVAAPEVADAGAVAWRRRRKGSAPSAGWTMCPLKPEHDNEFDLQPLYASPAADAGMPAVLDAAIHVINIFRSPLGYYDGALADAEKEFDSKMNDLAALSHPSTERGGPANG